MRTFATLTLLSLLTAAPARADDLDGRYICYIGGMSMNLGTIEIMGDSYRGPAYDDNWEGSYPFSSDGQVITWGGSLGGITLAGTVVSSVLVEGGFDITIQNDSGNFQTISCLSE
jgi:hypothetical protein